MFACTSVLFVIWENQSPVSQGKLSLGVTTAIANEETAMGPPHCFPT